MNSKRIHLIYLAIHYEGNYDLLLSALKKHTEFDKEKEEEAVLSLKCNVLTYIDDDYPIYLRQLTRPPLVLFYYGDISLIDDKHHATNLGVVGTRSATEYGLKHTKRIVSEVVDKCTIISGLAYGIDTMAHQTTIDNNGKTVAVLGSGIDNVYPIENYELYQAIIAKGGLVISEYPSKTDPHFFHFPIRNRLIAMFSSAILITEAIGYKTGTSITAAYARRLSRKVMCIPYPLEVTDSFCNQLIHDGDELIRDGCDILKEMKIID